MSATPYPVQLEKTLAEIQKLNEETRKFVVEQRKLAAEEKKLLRDTWWAPFIAGAALTGALVGGAATALKLLT